MGKRVLSVFLALALCVSLLPTTARAVDSDFTIENGVLTKYNGAGGDVTIPDGVTSIGNKAFSYCTSLTSMTIPDSVTSIGDNAFSYCVSLTSVTIPESVTTIGSRAFEKCIKLTSITIPDSVTSIGDYVFSECSVLTSVTIGNSVTSIGYRAFEKCGSLTSLTIPNSVISIGGYAFHGCRSLTSITIGNSVTSIGDYAFQSCSSLTSVTIPDSVTNMGTYTFHLCVKLTSVIIGNGVTSIGSQAFWSCRSLSSVTIGNSVTSIGIQAFAGCYLTNVTIPDSVTSIAGTAFNCSSLTAITVDDGNRVYQDIDGVLFSSDGKILHIYPAGKTSSSYTIPHGVTNIGIHAFDGCSSLASVTIPDSVTNIESCAFHSCSSLTSVTIPDSVTSIGEQTFMDCGSLTSVTIPDSVTGIAGSAFWGCGSLTSITIPDSVTSIGEVAFYSCSSLTRVTIPNSVTSIGWGAFIGCSSLTSVTIPDGVARISSTVFEGCSSLKKVAIPVSVKRIGEKAFYKCSSLTDVYYAGSEADWKAVRIDDYYDNILRTPLRDATIHYNSNGIPAEADIIVQANQYCIHVVDENGVPVQDAAINYASQSGMADSTGNAFFELFTVGTPLIVISKDGYTTWTNASSNWRKSPNRCETVVLYPESYGGYKLREAYYANNSEMTGASDILTHTKKLNLKNDGNLIGDLTNGEFYIACSATKTDGIVRYELWQSKTKVAESTTGSFDKLSVMSFTKGGGCFIRVVTADKQVDTHINLEFAENEVNKENSISFKTDTFLFKLADSVPILGGSNINFKIPDTFPVTVVVSDIKLQLGINYKSKSLSGDSKTEQERYDDFKKTIDSFRNAKSFTSMSWSEQNHFLSFLQDQNKIEGLPDGWKNREVYFAGYAESDWGSKTATLKGIFIVTITALNIEKNGLNFWGIFPVPWTAHLKLEGEGSLTPEVTYDFSTSTLQGNFDLELKPKLDAFGGGGHGEYFSGGVYASAELDVLYRLLALGKPTGLQKIDLTGEFGIRGYIAKQSISIPFAHQTWHLYTANNVSLLSAAPAWNEGLYDASAYAPDDLSYLTAESGWLGGRSMSLLSAEAKTEFQSLLTDTYRNAQPVMVSSGDAIYAAFVRADAESGSRYVVVTKSEDGTSWAEPVRVDADAILDNAPALCVDEDGSVWLAYARTTSEADDSLLTYAQNQEVVVGSIDPDTLAFTERKTFVGSGYAHMQQLAVIDGQPVLMWADTALTDENSVLLPASGTIRYAVYDGGAWGDAVELTSVTGALTSVTPGAQNGQIAAAYVSDGTLYCATTDQTTELASDVPGRVRYDVLPGTSEAAFLWNGNGMLCSSNGDEISAEGISHEYAIVGDKIYYSMATDNSANLAVLQYENGNWSLPIQLTGDSRYLENLSAARLNGDDIVMGMHTAVTITENSVEDAKNLVVSRVMPVSDLRIDGVDYDDGNLTAGESVPVTVTVINAGDHTVNSIDLVLNDVPVKTESVALLPGQSVEIETEITCPSTLTNYVFTVSETGESDYTPSDNTYKLSVGYADAAVALDYQQIGTSKALVATVTNQGIDVASGSVVFYDADGNPVAESTFENLASGGVAVASYAVTDSFTGVNGGDVSAKVELDQDELYTYNNEVTMHILKAYTPTSVKSISKLQGGIAAEVVFGEDVHATVLCATYDSAGKMLHVESETVDASEGETYTFDFAVEDAGEVKVFVLGGDHDPLCEARESAMQTD